jgi:hypothetical protein
MARAVDANRAADAIRKRWRIENKSHRRRGVQRLGDPAVLTYFLTAISFPATNRLGRCMQRQRFKTRSQNQ